MTKLTFIDNGDGSITVDRNGSHTCVLFKRGGGGGVETLAYEMAVMLAAQAPAPAHPPGMVLAPAELPADVLDAANEAAMEGGCDLYGMKREILNAWAVIAKRYAAPVVQGPAVGADEARDAARYRWLKSLPGASPRLRGMAIDGGATLKNGFRAPHTVYIADSIDGAIDAAMGEVKPPVQGSDHG